MSDGTPFLRIAADRIGAPGSPATMPFRATNAANRSSIVRIGAKMAVIRRQSFEGKLHVERLRATLNELGGFQMGNPGLMPTYTDT